MIDWERTEWETGFGKKYFEKYPGSGRKVCVVCDECGEVRFVCYRDCGTLCGKCARKKQVGHNASNWKGGKITTNCSYCNKKIKRFLSDIKGLTFCKKGCHNKWMEENMAGANSLWYGKYGADHPAYGQKRTEKTRNLMSESAKKRKYDSEICIICSKSFMPNNNVQVYCEKCDRFRIHVTPIQACIQLNQRFPGSEGHHIMSSVIIFVPKILHQSNYHNLKTGKGMDEINELAFDFLHGAQW